MRMEVSETQTFTLDGAARFYTTSRHNRANGNMGWLQRWGIKNDLSKMPITLRKGFPTIPKPIKVR